MRGTRSRPKVETDDLHGPPKKERVRPGVTIKCVLDKELCAVLVVDNSGRVVFKDPKDPKADVDTSHEESPDVKNANVGRAGLQNLGIDADIVFRIEAR